MARTAKSKKPAPAPAPDPEPAPSAPPAAPAAAMLPAKPTARAPRGLEDVAPEDLVVPRFRIVQPTSDEGTAGNFRDVISGEEYESLEGVVPLRFTKGRVYFLRPEEGGGLACASDDRIVPAERIEKPVQARCAGCPRAKWSSGEGGKRIKPDCSETWTLLMAVDAVPYFITFKSAAMSATKKLLTQLTLRAKKQRLDVCGFQFDMRLELHKFDMGKAYLPVFENVCEVAEPEYQAYQSLYDAFAHIQPTFDDEHPGEEVAASAADESPSGGDPTSFDFGE